MPKRIQRKRTRGWRMPPNTIYVGRPSKFGNPIRWDEYRKYPSPFWPGSGEPLDAEDMRRIPDAERRRWAAVDFEAALLHGIGALPGYPSIEEIRAELAGMDLACWCSLGSWCHADTLLRVANPEVES
jgi:hypothetical protein